MAAFAAVICLSTASAQVVDLRPCFALRDGQPGSSCRVVLRHFQQGGRSLALEVDADSLETAVVPRDAQSPGCSEWALVRSAIAGTHYGESVAEAESNSVGLQDSGIVHAMPAGRGVVLTIDLCPSRLPLDRSLFADMIAALGPEERPVPVAIAVTGVWMDEHPDDLAWLLGLVERREFTITWIDHTFSHRFDRSAPLSRNFLLEPGTNLEAEILHAERAMLEHGMVPSAFFRFPGLVSSRELFDRVVAYGLVPVGSDAWLAKGQKPEQGSIVLVHGNGNEPLGVQRFLRLLRSEGPRIRDRDWLLFDLRRSASPEDAALPGESRFPAR